jgi:CDGSH-type Zn-finger protein
MADVTVTVRKNASYRLEGPIRVVDPEGNEFTFGEGPVFLCRCGHSGNKPFCDGSHKSSGFEADTRAKPAEG